MVSVSGAWAARVLSPPISVNDSVHIGSMMMADPLIHQHGQRQNMRLTIHGHSRCETFAIDIADLLSFRKKFTWVFDRGVTIHRYGLIYRYNVWRYDASMPHVKYRYLSYEKSPLFWHCPHFHIITVYVLPPTGFTAVDAFVTQYYTELVCTAFVLWMKLKN